MMLMTQGITAMGDPHNIAALDGILTQERGRRDISSTLQRLSVLSLLLAMIMLLSTKRLFQIISSRARIFELKSVKNVKLFRTERKNGLKFLFTKMVWFLVTWTTLRVYITAFWDATLSLGQVSRTFEGTCCFYFWVLCTHIANASGLWIPALCPMWDINAGGCAQGWRSA